MIFCDGGVRMKLLTLNTHSLMEPDYTKKLEVFAAFLLRERPEIIALQEVNQPVDAPPAKDLCGMVPADEGIPLKEGNYALSLARRLRDAGAPASWAYLPVKLGYGRFDEGLAVICMEGRIADVDACTVSRTDDYSNWRTRRVLGVRTDVRPDWFYSVHMGWWQDEEEPFAQQWAALDGHLAHREGRIWLLGDFNAPAELRGQGYDLIAASGWQDVYRLAKLRDGNCTVRGAIDGWHAQDAPEGMRIDHIWCSESAAIARCSVVLDGRHAPVVSDHFGLMAEERQDRRTISVF